MPLTHESISKALAHAEQAVHDLKGAKWILIADPLTFAEGAEVSQLVKSAEEQMKSSLKILEP